jgi:hypothetical protein
MRLKYLFLIPFFTSIVVGFWWDNPNYRCARLYRANGPIDSRYTNDAEMYLVTILSALPIDRRNVHPKYDAIGMWIACMMRDDKVRFGYFSAFTLPTLLPLLTFFLFAGLAW